MCLMVHLALIHIKPTMGRSAVDLTALIGGSGAPGECGSQPFESYLLKQSLHQHPLQT
jgi:hypothetical protein